MTLTVSLNRVGIVRATELLHQARNDAARRHETEIRTVSVAVEPAGAEAPDTPPGQRRVVDLRV